MEDAVATSQSDASTTAYTSYDAVGHVLSSNQTTAGNTYSFGYTYNLAGALTSETYPSGRVVSTCYDRANRVSIVSWHGCGNLLGWFATNVTYAAHGAMTQYQMGNNVWHNAGYNSRLQMSGFTDAVNNSNGSILLTASLNWGSSNNNGNLQSVSYNNGGPGYPSFVTFNQNFTYDGLNRLKTATDSGGWSRSFAYDAYGNMTPSGTPAPPTVSFNTNNQIVSAPYDQAGNLTSANGNTLGYDFESRIVSETDGVSKAVETYVVDGNGNRVEKYGPSGAGKSVFVDDALGRMAAEYTNFSETPNCLTCYLTRDHLGTARVVTDQAGNVVARHDYLPFGEEVAASQYGRDSYWGPGSDTIHQKFTGKERDSESGLDYFGARYYGSALGRFTSPDEPLIDQHAINPQSWNLYGDARNNPLSYLDPTGNCSVKAGSAATDDPGSPCVTPGDTSITVTAQASDPDEERVTQLVTLTAGALDTQLRDTRNIAISAYLGEAAGFGIGKFVLGPIFTRFAAQRALQAATAATTGARAGRTWIAAYDVETGAVAVGHSGPLPNPADLDPGLLSAMDNAGGLGARNAGVVQPVGCCGEVNAANQLLQKGSKLENIRFTDAVRPRTGEVIPRCANCQATFGK